MSALSFAVPVPDTFKMANAERRFLAKCTCLWSQKSATRPGALILGENHIARAGLAGHRTLVTEVAA